MTEPQEYLDELAAWQAEWDALEQKVALLRAKRKHVVAKRKYDYVLQFKGKYWIRFRDTRNFPAGFDWAAVPRDHVAAYRTDTEKRAFWYARDIEKLKNIIGIEVVPVERT